MHDAVRRRQGEPEQPVRGVEVVKGRKGGPSLRPALCCDSIKLRASLMLSEGAMLDIANDIQKPQPLQCNTTDAIARMKQTGQPVVLTLNGKAAVVVQDAGIVPATARIGRVLEMMQFLEESRKDLEARAHRPLCTKGSRKTRQKAQDRPGEEVSDGPHPVRITRRAFAEIDEALAWLTARSPGAARASAPGSGQRSGDTTVGVQDRLL